jgi:hypothetical protein
LNPLSERVTSPTSAPKVSTHNPGDPAAGSVATATQGQTLTAVNTTQDTTFNAPSPAGSLAQTADPSDRLDALVCYRPDQMSLDSFVDESSLSRHYCVRPKSPALFSYLTIVYGPETLQCSTSCSNCSDSHSHARLRLPAAEHVRADRHKKGDFQRSEFQIQTSEPHVSSQFPVHVASKLW